MNLARRWHALLAHPATAPVLAWSYLLLRPFGNSSNLPLLIMAIAAAVLIRRHGRAMWREGFAGYYSLLWLAVWLPMLLSLPDSVRFDKSLGTIAAFVGYGLAGLFLVHALRDTKARALFLKLSAWLLAFWIVDALFMAAFGFDLLGQKQQATRLQGIFGEDSLKFGLALTMASPLLFEHARRHWPGWAFALAYLGCLAAVLLGQNRESWVVFGLITLAYAVAVARDHGMPPWRALLALALVGLLGGTAAYRVSPEFAQRVEQSARVFEGSYEAINAASSNRLPLWETAARMAMENPVNGVGVRAFRYVYNDYTGPGDPFYNPDTGIGAFYAHQIVLEVGSETGAIGLAGLMVFYGLLIRLWWRAGAAQRAAMLPFILSPAAWLMPLNTHTGFYGSFWGPMLWWLIALACAARADIVIPAKAGIQ
jgi:O-antigen ligase